jgi:hypothetical protein
MTKDIVPSATIILPKRRLVDPKELPRESGPAGRRKLPPEPGRVERPNFIPEDEILPRPPTPTRK